jgi:hypothetical protein
LNSQNQKILKDNFFLFVKTQEITDVQNDIRFFLYPLDFSKEINLVEILNDFENRIIFSYDRLIMGDFNDKNNSSFMIDSILSIPMNKIFFAKNLQTQVSIFFIKAEVGYNEIKKQNCDYIKFNFDSKNIEIDYEEISEIKLLTHLKLF